jgi:hypothetical protein
MKTTDVEVLTAPNVRRSLTTPGDIRSDISFQNDINSLLARIEEAKQPWTAASRLVSFGSATEPVAQPKRNTVTALRVFDGGAVNRPTLGGEPHLQLVGPAPQRMRRRA